jgi:peptidase M42 family hydrolase
MRELDIDAAWLTATLEELLATPSPTGATDAVSRLVAERCAELGIATRSDRRGTLIGRIAARGSAPDRPARRAVAAHLDTIGMMVAEVKADGRLRVVPVGTHSPRFSEGARVLVLRDPGAGHAPALTGTVLPLRASGHAFGDAVDELPHRWDLVEVRLDAAAADAAAVADLGVRVGDLVAHVVRPDLTPSGHVVSRHLDDKGGVAALLAACRALRDADIAPAVDVDLLFTVSEEVGNGASHCVAPSVEELVAVECAVVAPGQTSTETGVTLVMQDMNGPTDRRLNAHLEELGAKIGLEMHRDVFMHFRTDAAAAIVAGADVRTAIVGFGVDATHGHERTHIDGLVATARLLASHLGSPLIDPS